MKLGGIKDLIDIIEQSSIDVLKFENIETKLFFQKNNAGKITMELGEEAAQPSPKVTADETIKESEHIRADEDNGLHQICSPMVGTYYSRANPEAEPFVQVGSKVKRNQPVCVLEAMKLFNEVVADADGEIIEILVKDGQVIEYGQPLFVVKVSV